MSKNLKYKLTEEFILVGYKKLFRIRALKDFGDVKSGDLGGFIEKENNLSQEGNCWVSGDARAYGNARIYGNARVYGNAQIYGGSWAISPFYVCLSKHSITSCNFSIIKIGCLVNTIEEWKDWGEEIGKENGYSDTEIELYLEAIKLAEKHIELAKRSTK